VLKPGSLLIPQTFLFPFGLYFLTLWFSLLQNPPIDVFLFSIARVFLYFIFTVFLFAYKKNISEQIGYTVFFLGLIESFLIRFNYTRLHPIFLEQFGGRLGNPLHSGILIPVGVFVALPLLFKNTKARKELSLLYLVAICFLVYATFLLRARAAMLSIAFLALFFIPRPFRKTAFMIGTLLGVMLIFFARQKIMRYLEIDQYGFLSTIGRFSIWKTDLMALRVHPLLGYGLGNFQYAYIHFHQPSSEYLHYAKTTIFAHNGILQTAVDGGLPAVFFLLWGFRNTALLIAAKHKNIAMPPWYLMGLLVYAITSLFNYSLFLPFNGLVFSACIALSLHGGDGDGRLIPLQSFQWLLKSLLVFFCFFLLLLAISDQFANAGRFDVAVRFMPVKSDYWYQLALNELKKRTDTNYDQALLFLKRAALWDSHDPFVWSRIGSVLIARRDNSNQAADIEAAFQQAEEISPMHAPFWVEHGFYLLSIHDWEGARTKFQRANLLEPAVPLPLYGLGIVLMHDNQFSEALRMFASAKSMKENQHKVEDMSPYNRELIETPYGTYLYGIDVNTIDRLAAECAAQIHSTPMR